MMTSDVVIHSNILTPTELRRLFAKCVAFWGVCAQENMLQEECGELIVAVNHYRRGRVPPTKLLEEIADVMFTIGEVMYIHGFTSEDLDLMIDKKVIRVTDLITKEENKLAEATKFKTKEKNNGNYEHGTEQVSY